MMIMLWLQQFAGRLAYGVRAVRAVAVGSSAVGFVQHRPC